MFVFCRPFVVNATFSIGKKNTTIEWEDGGKIDNENKLILTEIFPSMHETYFKVLTPKLYPLEI